MSNLSIRDTRAALAGLIFISSLTTWASGQDKPVDASQLKVPEGFVVERVTAPPLVEHPMMSGFDEKGRLFVAESAGVNLKFDELLKDPPSKVLRLEDTNGDGVFDKRTVFADKLTFPAGALWHNGALYVTSPPGLWKFTDTNDDGVSDTREQIVTGFGSSGNAADLHGPFLGPEGWLYFTDGRNGHDVTLGDGTKWSGKAACVYRCKPDGSGLEVVFGGGFDNPVEVVFTPEGEPLVNVNLFQSQPHRIDAIVYGIEGSNYPHADAWKELKRTGEFQPSVGDLGWVATSGFMRYRGNSLGEKYAGKYFSTQFNPHRVQSHTVERDGAGFRVTHEDFLTCDNPDFHPTDILEDADGSLLVIDTGGWFRIGCPASQIAKPDVRGAIYRIKRKDGPTPLTSRPIEQVNEQILKTRLTSLARDRSAEPMLIQQLKDTDLAIRRESATGLGRLRSSAATAPLLDAAATASGDRFLEHAITFALIRISDRDALIQGLQHKNTATRRSALIALDQMDGGNLTVDLVASHLASEDPRLRESALAIATNHPEWAGQMAPTIRTALAKPEINQADADALRAAIAAFAHAEPVQAMVADLLQQPSTSHSAKLLLLQSIAGSGIAPLPKLWITPVQKSLGDPDASVAIQAIEAARASGDGAFDGELTSLARDATKPASARVAALAAFLPRAKSVEAEQFDLLRGELAADRDPLTRLTAANALSGAPLNNEQLTTLAATIAKAGPLELPALLMPFERSATPSVGAALVQSLSTSKSITSLTPAAVNNVLAKYPAEVQQSAASILARINPDAEAQKARMAELEPLLKGGNPNRGQSVFFNKTAACATCHAVRGTGAHVGPDLSKIASIRSPRDLLESIIFPSASYARGYESYLVQTRDRQVHAGVLAAETPDAIVLRTPAEVRIPRSSVKMMRQDRVSIMPQGLDTQMSKDELADLLAFLQTLK